MDVHIARSSAAKRVCLFLLVGLVFAIPVFGQTQNGDRWDSFSLRERSLLITGLSIGFDHGYGFAQAMLKESVDNSYDSMIKEQFTKSDQFYRIMNVNGGDTTFDEWVTFLAFALEYFSNYYAVPEQRNYAYGSVYIDAVSAFVSKR